MPWQQPSAALILFVSNMSFISQYLINQGMPEETLILLLMLPIVATIIAFARQVIGIKGFGIYTPLIISFAFLATGLRYGLALFLIILLVGTVMRLVVKKFRLLYLPRMAIVLTAVAVVVIALFPLGAYFDRNGLIGASILAILIMTTLVEKFIVAQIERGARGAIILTTETLFLSVVSFFVISWTWFQGFVLAYPFWIILAAILADILLGKWTGLRLTEYFRFKEVIKHAEISGKK